MCYLSTINVIAYVVDKYGHKIIFMKSLLLCGKLEKNKRVRQKESIAATQGIIVECKGITWSHALLTP